MAGSVKMWKQTKAETGFPGRPKKYFVRLDAKVIGFLREIISKMNSKTRLKQKKQNYSPWFHIDSSEM